MPTFDQWLAIAGVAAIIVAAVIGGLFTLRAKKAHRPPPSTAHSTVQAGGANANIHVGAIHVHPPAPSSPSPLTLQHRPTFREPPPAPAPQVPAPVAAPVQATPPPKKPVKKQRIRVCEVGPYEASAGGDNQIELDLEPGDRLTGDLQGDADFEFEILNALNYTRKHNDERYDVLCDGDGRRVYYVNSKVPRSRGPWYLVLEAYGKKNERDVLVNLYAERSTRSDDD